MARTEIDPEQQPLVQDAGPSQLGSGGSNLSAPSQAPAESDLTSLAPAPFGFAASVFRLISTATVVSSLACFISVALLSGATAQLALANLWRMALQVYSAALAVIVALLEVPASCPYITSRCPVFEPWVGRAFLQFLVAVLTYSEVELELNHLNPSGCNISPAPAPSLAPAPSPSPGGGVVPSRTVVGVGVLVGNAAVLVLTGCAVLHLVGGLLCAGQIKGYVMDRRRNHLRFLQEFRELDQRRASLRRGGAL